jgi:hypothetical protein
MPGISASSMIRTATMWSSRTARHWESRWTTQTRPARPGEYTCSHTKRREPLMAQQTKNRRWVAQVKTDSTHPPAGLFKKNASTIARSLASRKVSPKGPQSGMRMLNYFIIRAGRGLSRSRRAELERAKSLLSKRIRSRASRSSRKKRK